MSDNTSEVPNQIVPFLKWAGGKRWLANNFSDFFPNIEGRHIEPFAGSAAVFFALQPERAILSDLNGRLIETYLAIKQQRAKFEKHFLKFGSQHSKDFYYETRSARFRSPEKRAAQFLYLNRVCFNGIYRENLRGEFNVPIGSKTKAVLDTDDFRGVSARLKNVELLHQDFETTIYAAVKGDFVYIDPPYTTKHNMNGFVKYNQNIFSWDDQIRLAASVKRAVSRGVTVMVSNADHADVRALYSDFLSIHSVSRSNVIASKSAHRGTTTEMVATNV